MVRGDVAHRLCLVSLLNNRFVAVATATPCQIDEWSFHCIMETCSSKKEGGAVIIPTITTYIAVVVLCLGELGFFVQRCYDNREKVWLPSEV